MSLEIYQSLHKRYAEFCSLNNVPDAQVATRKDVNRVLKGCPEFKVLYRRHRPDVGICSICNLLSKRLARVSRYQHPEEYSEVQMEQALHMRDFETQNKDGEPLPNRYL